LFCAAALILAFGSSHIIQVIPRGESEGLEPRTLDTCLQHSWRNVASDQMDVTTWPFGPYRPQEHILRVMDSESFLWTRSRMGLVHESDSELWQEYLFLPSAFAFCFVWRNRPRWGRAPRLRPRGWKPASSLANSVYSTTGIHLFKPPQRGTLSRFRCSWPRAWTPTFAVINRTAPQAIPKGIAVFFSTNRRRKISDEMEV
jgi:hypothetical protein